MGDRNPESDGEASESSAVPAKIGPDILHDDPATPPQFQSSGKFRADPLLVSGEDAYVGGEYLYQDYVYDDKGAATGDVAFPPPDGPIQPVPNPSIGSHSTGRFVYPEDDEKYGYNAADLLEFRATLDAGELSYRITLQTMKRPEVAAVAIGIDTGSDGGTDDWGYGIGELGELGLDYVLVTWGTGAELVRIDGEDRERETLPTSLDVDANQITVPTSLSPDGETWRHYAVVGLWDDAEGAFKEILDRPTSDDPGGARGTNPPPVFNVAFRFDESTGLISHSGPVPGAPEDMEDGTVKYGQRRDHAQATALADRDISPFYADIDAARLESNATEEATRESGFLNRLYASRYSVGEGVQDQFGRASDARPSDDRGSYDLFMNEVQPYGLYVPEGYDPSEPHPLHLHLHGGSQSCNTTTVRENFHQQFGDERDALVLVPEARGPGTFYQREAELDVLEAMSDVASRYNIDLDRVTVSGVSMGGYGAFRFSSRYPDVFAKAVSIVGAHWPDSEALLDSLRTVPVLMINGLQDDLAIPANFLPSAVGLEDRGYRHELNMYLHDNHGGATKRDEWSSAIAFLEGEYLGGPTRDRSPDHLTYTRIPDIESPELDLRHDGAFWMSVIEVAEDADEGTVDARLGSDDVSHEHYSDLGDEPAEHVVIGTRWEAAESDEEETVHVSLEDVTAVTFDLDWLLDGRDAPADISVETNRNATITLVQDGETTELSVPAGTHRRELPSAGDGA